MTAHLSTLFDIDGTLVDTQGVGRQAFTRAICETLRIDDSLETISFAGATDLNVFRTICSKHGIVTSSDLEHNFFARLKDYLRDSLHANNTRLLPGLPHLLERLAEQPKVKMGLLTGNARNCAYLKLAPHNLDHYFSFGAFGDEFDMRPDIARKARERAVQLNPATIPVVIGDTPLDVLAAHAIDAPCLAVATGQYTQDELKAAQADYVLHDLSDTEIILQLLQNL